MSHLKWSLSHQGGDKYITYKKYKTSTNAMQNWVKISKFSHKFFYRFTVNYFNIRHQIDKKCKVLMKCLLLFWLPFIICWRFYYPWQQWQCHLSQYFTLFYSSAVRWHGLIEARYFIYYTKTIQSEERQPNLPQRSQSVWVRSLSVVDCQSAGRYTDTRTVSITRI